MQHPRVDGLDRCRQSGIAVGQDQLQMFAFEPATIQILQQPFPGLLVLPFAA